MFGAAGAAGGGVKLASYGELMCNPGKFDHGEREMGHKFYCLGGMLEVEQSAIESYERRVLSLRSPKRDKSAPR